MRFSKYKNPFYLLILLGFICQSFAAENYLFPLIFSAVFWFIGINLKRDKLLISRTFEALIFLLALIIFFKFGGDNYFSRCLALGNAFILLQVIRLLGPLDLRDKLFSVAMAMTQIAVGSQVILGYSFILVIIAVIYLLPNTFLHIHKFSFDKELMIDTSLSNQYKRKLYFINLPIASLESYAKYFLICFIAVVFFLLLPRAYNIADLGLIGRGYGFQLPKPELDMSFGGSKWSSEDVLFKVYGSDIGYLKCFSLDTFDGNLWTAHKFSYRHVRDIPRSVANSNLQYRKVSIENSDYDKQYLPTDGVVEGISGNFFYFAKETAQGNVMTLYNNKHKTNKVYEYWTDLLPSKKILKFDKKRYTEIPETSSRLKRWLNEVIGSETDQYRAARKIENYLKNNYYYELGTPELNKEYPVDDLIFNNKTGHCARFAGALAVLFRMEGIPARVVVGYYTMEKNEVADFYRVRASNAHAWVEAYIDGKGWTIFDATPYATERYHHNYLKNRTIYTAFYDWIEYVWYGKIVNFSRGEQTAVIGWLQSVLIILISNIKYIAIVIGSFLGIFIVVYFILKLKSFFSGFSLISVSRERQIEFADHFYGRMLRILARKGIYRNKSQTPFEFLEFLEENEYTGIKNIRFLTKTFCSVKYGNRNVSKNKLNEIHKALKEMKR